MVPFRPHQLVEVVQGREAGLAEQGAARGVGPLQVLPHPVVPQPVQQELQLQHRPQPPLLRLLALQLLPPRRLLHRLLDLQGRRSGGEGKERR